MKGNRFPNKRPLKELIEEIRKLWNSGWTIGYVADLVGVSRDMVRKYGKYG